jgi:PAS domain S-box-containing protein
MQNELSCVVDLLPGLVWTALPDGNVNFLNRRWREYTGIEGDKAYGQRWQAMIHPDDLSGCANSWRAILASNEPGEMEARIRRHDGEYRWFLFQMRPIFDASGRVGKWCGTNSDIDVRKRAEEALALREHQLSTVLDRLPAFVNILTPEGKPEHVSQQYREYVGATLEEQKGWEIGQVFHPDDRSDALSAWADSVKTGGPYDIEARRRRADGVYRWFNLRAFPLRDGQGRVALWYSVHTDIDDRKRSDALLAGEKQLLEMVVSGHSMTAILETVCRLVESVSDSCYCSVVLVDPVGMTLENGVAPSLPPSFIASIIDRPVNVDSGPCAMAAYLNEQIIADDLSSEVRWASYAWCQMALSHGLKACWSTPIASTEGAVLGVFAIYYNEPKAPTSHDQEIINQITHIASIAIERQRSQTSLTVALGELKISESRLRTIVDAIPGMAWSATADGSVDFLNQRWCDYAGVRMEDALGSKWQKTIHSDDAGPLPAYWNSLLKSQAPGEFEARLRRFDGTFRSFLVRAVPVRDEAGHLVKWYGLNTDIEDRKQAESLLAGEKRLLEMVASDRPLTLVLESLCNLVENSAPDCRCSILLVDHNASRLQHGAAPSLPISFNESIHGLPLNLESGPCAMSAYLNEQVIAADITGEKRWDAYAWVPLALAHGLRACWSTPIASVGGKVLGVFAIYYAEPRAPTPQHQNLIGQITHLASIAIERAQGEMALRRSEAFLAKAQRLSLSGSFSWRVATAEITWSEQLYRIFEIDKGTPVTLDLIGSRVHPEDMPLMHDMSGRAQAGKDFEYEHRLQMPDGSVKYLHMLAHGARDQDGQLEYIGAVQDVTERRSSEEALSKARSELARVARVTSLGALTASIAHEVNQPLSGIITNASTCLRMLAASPPNLDGARETVRRTIRDGHRASDVITRLRALFTKKDATVESVDLNETAREVIALSLSELQRGRVILKPEFTEDLPPVEGDRVQIQQVILNLLLNASDAMSSVDDRERQLVIKTTPDDDDRIRLTVQDAGVGFEPQGAEKLFEAFYSTKSGGMGIGLAISRSIIESHRGRLWATPNDGPGATFSFSIPRMQGAVKEVYSPNPPPESGSKITEFVSASHS